MDSPDSVPVRQHLRWYLNGPGLVRHHVRSIAKRRAVHDWGEGTPPVTLPFIFNTGDYAVVSATKGVPRTDAEIKEQSRRTEELLNLLFEENYEPVLLIGHYVYREGDNAGIAVTEPSYLVRGMSREAALRIGRRFGQETVIQRNQLLRVRDGFMEVQFRPHNTLFGPEARRQEYWSETAASAPWPGVTFALRP